MTKKKAIALAIFLVLAAAGYIYLYGGAFAKKEITIFHTRSRSAVMRRPNPNAQNTPPPPVNVTFAMDTFYPLTSVKVVDAEEYKTNQYHPLWEMISDSNSPPIKTFSYGENIKGMHPAIKGARPEPLSNDVAYRLFVVSGKIKGEHNFTLPGTPLGVPTNAPAR